jgi:CBS domain-containing protein
MREKLRKRTVREEMTPTPVVIEPDDTISRAAEVMRSKKIRHLPVLADKKLVGILSDRVLKAAMLTKIGGHYKVVDVMIPEPYRVKTSTDLGTVIDAMIAEKIGSAVVVDDNEKVVGIFTSTDGLRVLRDLLST